ncbi:MAG: helix-turn-helix domain-containing protein [Smithella sp.]
MKLEIEQADIEAISSRVAEILKPVLSSVAKHDEKETLLDVAQLAAYLNVSKSWIYDQIRNSEIPHSKLGKYLRFRRREIDKWIETQSFKPFPNLKVIKSK